MPRKKYPTPAVEKIHPPARSAQLAKIVNDAIDRFSGPFDELEKALGMLMMGDYVGWKVLVLIHSKSTLKKYEAILGINVREFFTDVGLIADRSNGYRLALELKKFWKVVSGDEPVEDRRGFSSTT